METLLIIIAIAVAGYLLYGYAVKPNSTSNTQDTYSGYEDDKFRYTEPVEPQVEPQNEATITSDFDEAPVAPTEPVADVQNTNEVPNTPSSKF